MCFLVRSSGGGDSNSSISRTAESLLIARVCLIGICALYVDAKLAVFAITTTDVIFFSLTNCSRLEPIKLALVYSSILYRRHIKRTLTFLKSIYGAYKMIKDF